MSSVPSIPGVTVGAPWSEGYERLLTADRTSMTAAYVARGGDFDEFFTRPAEHGWAEPT